MNFGLKLLTEFVVERIEKVLRTWAMKVYRPWSGIKNGARYKENKKEVRDKKLGDLWKFALRGKRREAAMNKKGWVGG